MYFDGNPYCPTCDGDGYTSQETNYYAAREKVDSTVVLREELPVYERVDCPDCYRHCNSCGVKLSHNRTSTKCLACKHKRSEYFRKQYYEKMGWKFTPKY